MNVKTIIAISSLFLAAGTLVGCRTVDQPPHGRSYLKHMEFQEPHMGTLFTITLYADSVAAGRAAAVAGFARVKELNSILSDYDADSELVRLCEAPHGLPVEVSEDLYHVLSRSLEIAKQSDGAFDVTLGPLIRLWRQSRRTRVLPTPEAIATARKSVGWQNLKLDPRKRTVTLLVPGMRLDVGGIAKGYAADETLKVLRLHGINRALVAASGDLAIGDAPPNRAGWTVGLSLSATDPSGVSDLLTLTNRGVSTSGDSQQFVEIEGKRYSHIVDPGTGLGLTNPIQVTVVASSASTSDALATALCLTQSDAKRKQIIRDHHLEVFITSSASTYATPGFKRFRVSPDGQKRL